MHGKSRNAHVTQIKHLGAIFCAPTRLKPKEVEPKETVRKRLLRGQCPSYAIYVHSPHFSRMSTIGRGQCPSYAIYDTDQMAWFTGQCLCRKMVNNCQARRASVYQRISSTSFRQPTTPLQKPLKHKMQALRLHCLASESAMVAMHCFQPCFWQYVRSHASLYICSCVSITLYVSSESACKRRCCDSSLCVRRNFLNSVMMCCDIVPSLHVSI